MSFDALKGIARQYRSAYYGDFDVPLGIRTVETESQPSPTVSNWPGLSNPTTAQGYKFITHNSGVAA